MVRKKEINTSPYFSIWTLNNGSENLAEPMKLWHRISQTFLLFSFNFSAALLVYFFGGKHVKLFIIGRIFFLRKFLIYNLCNTFRFFIFLHYIYLAPLCTAQCLGALSLLLKPLFIFIHKSLLPFLLQVHSSNDS